MADVSTVKKLREYLAGLDDDLPVYISTDQMSTHMPWATHLYVNSDNQLQSPDSPGYDPDDAEPCLVLMV